MKQKLNLDRIIYELSNDDDSSLEELFSYYYSRLYNFSRSFLKMEESIDDIIQEVFIKIWKNRKKIKSSDTFNSYIFTITRNLLLNELRSQLNKQSVREEVRKRSIGKNYDLLEQVEYDDLKKEVEKVIAELPERQKEIFILSRTEGLSHTEIAEKLGISTKTVEYHISLAIRFVKDKLNALGLISLLYFYLFI